MIRIDFENTKMHSFAVLFSECYGFLLGVKIRKLITTFLLMQNSTLNNQNSNTKMSMSDH